MTAITKKMTYESTKTEKFFLSEEQKLQVEIDNINAEIMRESIKYAKLLNKTEDENNAS